MAAKQFTKARRGSPVSVRSTPVPHGTGASHKPSGRPKGRSTNALVSLESGLHAEQYLRQGMAVLECVIFSMTYQRDALEGELPLEVGDFAISAQAVLDCLKQAIANLDPLRNGSG